MFGEEGKLPASSPTNVLTVEDSINSFAKSFFNSACSLILEELLIKQGKKKRTKPSVLKLEN